MGTIRQYNQLIPNKIKRDRYSVELLDLGLISFSEGRSVQELWILRRQSGACGDLIILCEHLPTLSLGQRAKENELGLSIREWQERGVEVIKSDRGGAVTYHAPGQLIIYPVISLRELGIGVKRFVELGLSAMVDALKELGVAAEADLRRAGVWCAKAQMDVERDSQSKIASVGLRIRNGISNHGFSLNVNLDLNCFSLFTPCAEAGVSVTSVLVESKVYDIQMQAIKRIVYEKFLQRFNAGIS